MAKVNFHVDNGANIQSDRDSGWLDTVDDLGMDEGEWETMSDEEKENIAWEWGREYIETWYEEKND